MKRRGQLLPLLVLLLIAVPILEVWLLIQAGQLFGVIPTVLILVAEALLGSWLMRREGTRSWLALNAAFQTGRMPTAQLTDAALVLVGGVLLILPGFATDVVGLCCLLPFTRPLPRRLLGWLVARRISQLGGSLVPTFPSGRRFDDGTVIRGETVPEGTSAAQPGSGTQPPDIIVGEIEDRPR